MKTFLQIYCIAAFFCGCNSLGEIGNGATHGIDANGNVWMTPPPPGEGIQMAILPFHVPDSSEVQGDFYFDFPSDLDFEVGRIEIAMNQGTHHMNCFLTPISFPKDSGIGRKMVMRRDDGRVDSQIIRYQNEFNSSIVWNQSDLVIEAELPYMNWSLPEIYSGTDSAKQSVIKLPARNHMVIENHYVNLLDPRYVDTSLTPNNKGAVIINLWKASSAKPSMTASMLVAKKTTIQIPAYSIATFKKDCRFLPSSIQWPIYILGMTGHFHSRGKSFIVDKMRNILNSRGNIIGDTVIENDIYRNASWSEPAFTSYDTPVRLNCGEFLRYTTEYVNNTDCTLNFGPHQNTDEMCNLFAWFVPSYNNGQTLYDNIP